MLLTSGQDVWGEYGISIYSLVSGGSLLLTIGWDVFWGGALCGPDIPLVKGLPTGGAVSVFFCGRPRPIPAAAKE